MVKISIILAVYNGAIDVEKCLESLTNQTYKNIEIVCIDDGSTDNTLEILTRYAKRDERVRIFSQGDNKKLLLAIKRGVRESTGDYIMFIDDDDWYELNACERIAEIAASKQPDIIHYGTSFYTKTPTDSKRRARLEKRLVSQDFEYNGGNTLRLDGIDYIYLWTRAVKAPVCKRAYDAIPDVELNFYSDSYACEIFHYFGKSIVSTSERLINHIYEYGVVAQMMTADKYASYMNAVSIYEEGIKAFFTAQCEIEELRYFEAESENRVKSCIRRWRDKVINSDSVEAFNCLIEYYGADTVLPLLHEDYHTLRVKLKKCRMKLAKAKKRPKKKSIISRIKRKIKSLLK